MKLLQCEVVKTEGEGFPKKVKLGIACHRPLSSCLPLSMLFALSASGDGLIRTRLMTGQVASEIVARAGFQQGYGLGQKRVSFMSLGILTGTEQGMAGMATRLTY